MNSTMVRLIIILAVLLPDIYIIFAVLRHSSWVWSALIVLPTVLLFLLFFLRLKDIIHYNEPYVVLLCCTLPKMVYMLFSIVGVVVSFFWHRAFMPTNVVALFISLLFLVCILFGLTIGWQRLFVRDHHFYFADLPDAFDGYRIMQISDLHLGTYGTNTDYIHKIVEETNKRKPDLIVFTGDIVNITSDELRPFISELSRLAAPDGVVSILGNHDYCVYGLNSASQRAEHLEKIKQMERGMGWHLLLDERIQIVHNNDSIALIGVENYGKPPFPQHGNLKNAIAGIPEREFKILLSHDPSHWRLQVLPLTDIQLTLSGHTHAAQIKIGDFSPSKWVFKEWAGEYHEGNQMLFVSTGVGGTIPFRFGAWPSIEYITLHRKK